MRSQCGDLRINSLALGKQLISGFRHLITSISSAHTRMIAGITAPWAARRA